MASRSVSPLALTFRLVIGSLALNFSWTSLCFSATDCFHSGHLQQRHVEEVSAKGRGLFRKRVLEAPMHEHAGGPPEVPAMLDATIASPGDRVGGLQRPSVGRPTAGAPELDELVRIASTLDPGD